MHMKEIKKLKMIEMLDKWGEGGGVLNDLNEGVKIKTVPVNKKNLELSATYWW